MSYGVYLFKDQLALSFGGDNRNYKNDNPLTRIKSDQIGFIALIGIITTTVVLPSTHSRAYTPN
jgi:hypothetical protein